MARLCKGGNEPPGSLKVRSLVELLMNKIGEKL